MLPNPMAGDEVLGCVPGWAREPSVRGTLCSQTSSRAISTHLRDGSQLGAFPWLHASNSQLRASDRRRAPISHAPNSPSCPQHRVASHWCWAVGQPELFVGAVLQTLLMDCDGPDSGFIMVHGEGRGEKAASRLGLHWGSFKAGIPSRATSNHWPNMSNSHFKEG